MPAPQCITLLLVDDHSLVRMGIAAVLGAERELRVVAQADDGTEALSKFREHRPDVTLMDLRLGGSSGIDAAAAILREASEARILMLTTYDSEGDIEQAIDAGVCGYVLKSARREELVAAIRKVHAGDAYLPPEIARRLASARQAPKLSLREREILAGLSRGLTNREIALMIGRSENTIKAQLKTLFAKLDVADRAEAVVAGIQRGVLEI